MDCNVNTSPPRRTACVAWLCRNRWGCSSRSVRLPPLPHCECNCLTCQVCPWPLPFEDEIKWCAAAQRLKQSHCVATNADHSRFRSFAEQMNLAAIVQPFNVIPFQPRYFADATPQQVRTFDQNIITLSLRAANGGPCDYRQQASQIFFAD